MTQRAPKKRGRPRKVYSEKPSVDAECRKPTDCWDFTDYEVPYLVLEYDPGLVAKSSARLDWWKSLDFKTLDIAHEVCPNTTTIHGQGRIRFKRKYRFAQLKKIFPPDVHFEPSACQIDDNYLRKYDSIPIVRIDNRHQGKRNVFKEQVDAIKDGASVRDCISLEGANYQSIRSAELLMKYIEPERPHGVVDVQLVSRTDVLALDTYRLCNMAYWDGYDAHTDVFIDQHICKLTLAQLRTVCGPASFRLPRGRQARYSRIYICNVDNQERKALGLPPKPNV